MSDWELVEDQSSNKKMRPSSDWEVLQEQPKSMRPQENESLGAAAFKAPFRVGEDVIKGLFHTIKNIPGYYENIKQGVPSAMESARENPMGALKQGSAGVAELGQNVFNTPHDISNYLSNRLNLLPKDINQKIQMGRMPLDTNEMINKHFGAPSNEGEQFIKGLGRNSLNLLGGAQLTSIFNPYKLSAKGIANDILKTEKMQSNVHGKKYNQIWKEAEKSGFNQVPIDKKLLSDNLDMIKKYKTSKEYKALDEFIKSPTLEKAQRAQSDMGVVKRALEEKSRKGSLLSEEKNLYEAAKDAEKHIEENMFKNNKGEVNQSLQNKYSKLTKSYRENVVPYKYNKDIQAYKNKEMLPKELVNALSRGEFAAKKGNQHPAMTIRNNLLPAVKTLGAGGVLALLYENMMGNKPVSEQGQ
jgi:hypothetical protein